MEDGYYKRSKNSAILGSLLLWLLILSRGEEVSSLFLAATPAPIKQDKEPTGNGFKKVPSFITATKKENGVTFEYSNDNGLERLRVLGHLSPAFDADAVMQEFRDALKLGAEPTCKDEPKANRPSDTERERSLLDSFSDFFAGSKFAIDVQKYYDAFTSRENYEQVELAQRELITVEDDLSKVQTQKLILSKRQSELGAWIRGDLRKPMEERNPTVEELVHTESDRLALLEHRLQRLENKLTAQKGEIMSYLRLQDRAKVREVYEKLDEDTHIFTRKDGCSASHTRTIIPEESDFDYAHSA